MSGEGGGVDNTGLAKAQSIAATPWYEMTDGEDDEVDDEAVRRKVADRCRQRKEAALAVSRPGPSPPSPPSSGLRRTRTQQHQTPSRGGGGGSSTPVSSLWRNNSVRNAPATTRQHASFGNLGHAAATSMSAHPPSPVEVALPPRHINMTKTCRARTSESGSITFSEPFDIWYADPSSLKRRGTDCHTYACALQKVGEFQTIQDFYAFHNALVWDNIKDGSIIAYSRGGIKPQWEDSANQNGGRFVLKQFPKSETESIFTKIALSFFSGMLLDWDNYNLVSLHIRAGGRGSDVQLWRGVDDSKGGLTSGLVKSDLRSFVEIPQLSVGWVPNKESLSRNDSRMGRSARSRGGFDSSTGLYNADSSYDNAATGIGSADQLVRMLYEERGSGISKELRDEIAAQQAQDFAQATPVGIGLEVPESMLIGADLFDAPRGSVTAQSDSSHSLGAGASMIPSPSSPIASDTPKPKCTTPGGVSRFGFLKSVLSSGTTATGSSTTSSIRGRGGGLSPTDNSQQQEGILDERSPSRNRLPYPDYENPIQIKAWKQGMEQLQARSSIQTSS